MFLVLLKLYWIIDVKIIKSFTIILIKVKSIVNVRLCVVKRGLQVKNILCEFEIQNYIKEVERKLFKGLMHL